MRRLTFLAAALAATALPALAQTPAPVVLTPAAGPTEFIAIDGTERFIALASPQLITRGGEGGRITATLLMALDPPTPQGGVAAGYTMWVWCDRGQVEIKDQTVRDLAGKVVQQSTPPAGTAAPEPGTIQASFLTFVCQGKVRQADAARFPSLDAALEGSKAMLARARAEAAANPK